MMTSLRRHFIFYSKFPYFVTLILSYEPAKFQIPQFSESNVREVWYKTSQKTVMFTWLP